MKLYGYIAKDQAFGARTFLYLSQPYRCQGIWYPQNGERCEAVVLPDDSFPNLYWGNDPVRVELIIKPVQKRLKKKLGVLGR